MEGSIMGIILTDEQEWLVQDICKWYKHSSKQVYEYAGGAGRGKSVVMNAAIYRLGLEPSTVLPMAYTGAASLVMRTKGLYNAKTIHSHLLKPIEEFLLKDGKLVYNEYFNRPTRRLGFEPVDTSFASLFGIDEGGTVPYGMKSEIEGRDKKIIVAGDLDQLPPVKDKPAYLTGDDVKIIHKPMRQAEDSGIFHISERARLGLPIHKGWYHNALVIDEDELTDEMIKHCDIMICSVNKTRDYWNNHVRRNILGITQDLPTHGERLICRKNNWLKDVDGINLVNGLIGQVSNYPNVSSFTGKTFNIDFLPNLIDQSFIEIPVDYNYFTAPYSMKNEIKNDRYNEGEKFEFAYCISSYLSQGSEFANVIYIEEDFIPTIQKNTNYVGASRAKNFLIYVKKKRRFYY
jgi:exodeoxyribonuclease-5